MCNGRVAETGAPRIAAWMRRQPLWWLPFGLWCCFTFAARADVPRATGPTTPYFVALERSRQTAAAKDYVSARAFAQSAVDRGRDEFGTQSMQAAIALNGLASYELRLQQIDAADRHAAEAVAIASLPPHRADKAYLSAFLDTRRAVLAWAQRDADQRDVLREMIALHASLSDPADPAKLARARMLLAELEFNDGDLAAAAQQVRGAIALHGALGEGAGTERSAALLLMARIEMRQGHPADARAFLDRGIQTGSSWLSWDPPQRMRFARDASRAYRDLNQLDDALSVAQAGLGDTEEGVRAPVPLQADLLLELASIHALRWQATEARRYVDLALARMGQELPNTHPTYFAAYYLSAVIRLELGDTEGAIDRYTEVLGFLKASSGEASEAYAFVLAERARALIDAGNPVRGVTDADRAIELLATRSGNGTKQLALAHAIRGLGLAKLERIPEAIAAFERELDLFERIEDPTSSDLPPGLTWLGRLYVRTGQLEPARKMLERAIAIRRRDAALSPAGVVSPLVQLAAVRLKQNDRRDARAALDEAMTIVTSRLVLSESSGGGDRVGEHTSQRETLEHMLDLALWLRQDSGATNEDDKTFRIAQLPHFSQTSQATSRAITTARVNDAALQDLLDRRRLAQDRLQGNRDALAPTALTDPGSRLTGSKADAPKTADSELALHELAAIDEALRKRFPQFAEMLYPQPVSIADVQAQLRPGEAFYLQVVLDDASVHCLVQATGLHIKSSLLNRRQIREHVARIRKSVEARPPRLDEYPTESAYTLYAQSIGLFASELVGTTDLVVVLDDGMQTIPLAGLLTAQVDSDHRPAGGWQELAFLPKRFSTVVAASASSFVVQRRIERTAASRVQTKAYLGIGDPWFAAKAPANDAATMRSASTGDAVSLFKRLPRLPVTREEITLISERLGTSQSRLLLGEAATEPAVRAAAQRDSYRVVSFATHGLLPGQAGAGSEATLALTPEYGAGPESDGLLTASEIAQMNLGAQWVLLSACNTAGADSASRRQVEGYSGLARAFFLAGAQSLLVSHWAVESNATYRLMVETVGKASREGADTRSHALNATMLEMLAGTMGPQYDHPLFWAPFVLIGASD